MSEVIWLICGGASAEHDISLLSAQNMVQNLFRAGYVVNIIYVNRQGQWFKVKAESLENLKHLAGLPGPQVTLSPGSQSPFQVQGQPSQACDCVVPLIHGTLGEDGSLQGLLNLLDVPYVGADVLGSAVIMAKHVAKKLLQQAGLPVVPWLTFHRSNAEDFDYEQVSQVLGPSLFIKPSAAGSSVGISLVKQADQYQAAVDLAFVFDHTILIEQAASGRELECSVLGTADPEVSLPGEIITQHTFYSYEAKYFDQGGSQTITPAQLEPEIVLKLQQLSVQAYQALECQGMARVDFFLTEQDEILINELNTIPGFTDISMYPKNWQVSGLQPEQLVRRLIEDARYQHEAKRSLKIVCDHQARKVSV